MKYFNNRPVEKIVREYHFGEDLYAEIMVDGEPLYVKKSEILDENQMESFPETHIPIENNAMHREPPVTPTIIQPEVVESEEVEENQPVENKIFIAEKENEVIEFSENDEIVKQKGWDLEAIHRIVEGKQKTHKGYTFKVK